MTRYSFILLSGQAEEFLEKIRETGLMDITRSGKPVDTESSAMLENAKRAQKAIELLERADYGKDEDFEAISAAAVSIKAPSDWKEAVRLTLETASKADELKNALAAAEKTLRDRLPWGDFSAEAIAGLDGYRFRFYCIPSKKFCEEWKSLYPLQIINDNGQNIRFVTVSEKDSEYSFPVEETAAPAGSWKEARKEADRIKGKIISGKALMLKLKECKSMISRGYAEELDSLDMYLAGESGEEAVENMVVLFRGFAPSENDAMMAKKLDELGVFYTKAPATEADNPPIRLKNNRFSRMFEVLTGMYGMPVYSEFDPTPILGPFFLLFFSMCMGDAGYGILLVIISFLLKKFMPGMARMAPLVMTLGIGTFFVGIILGTFFGISLSECAWVPQWLKSCMITGNIGDFSAQMVLAIGIGILHICLAMVVKAVGYTKRFGFRKTAGTWGWTSLIVGGVAVCGLTVLGLTTSEVAKWIMIILGVASGIGIYIFNDPDRNPLVNIGAGLWDTYNMVTGLAGDVLSYIRLYALGLAGGMLGGTFNDLGIMILDGVPVPGLNWILFAAIVLFGHALNLAMSCLGAFVHPLRLTFVEYFKNSGYEGRGTAFRPLKTNNANN